MQFDTIVYRVAFVRRRAIQIWTNQLSDPDLGVPNGSNELTDSTRQRIEVTMSETATTAPLFNPLSPDFIRDPYPHYARMRAIDPLRPAFDAFFVCR